MGSKHESVISGAKVRSQSPLGRTVRDYIALAKPRIIVLLLFTAFTGMVLAHGGLPPAMPLAAVMVGGILAAGGANAINQWFEQDIDGRMERTHHRPVSSGRIEGRSALLFGLALTIASLPVLALGANVTAAVLALIGNLFYVFVYTLWLKRSSVLNVPIGAAAGAVPPLVGWVAVTGGLEPRAWCLFAIVLFWTPPHLWALALRLRFEYAGADVPMLPVVVGEAWTRRAVLLYTLGLVAVTLLFATAAPALGIVYSASAAALGGVFVALSARLFWSDSRPAAFHLFKYSVLYLALLCAAAIVDGSVV